MSEHKQAGASDIKGLHDSAWKFLDMIDWFILLYVTGFKHPIQLNILSNLNISRS